MTTDELQSDQNTDVVIARLAAEVERLKADAKAFMAQRDAEKVRAETIQDTTDQEWLDAIGGHWMRLTGHPWTTRDGETREEGLQANIATLFDKIDDEKARADKAERECAEKNDAIKALFDVLEQHVCLSTNYQPGTCNAEYAWRDFADSERETMQKLKHALSSDCGQDHIPKRELEPTLAAERLFIEWCNTPDQAVTPEVIEALDEDHTRLEALLKGVK